MRKILSAIIALALVVSLFPVAFAAEANAENAGENAFVFSTDVHGNYTAGTNAFYKGNVTVENADTSLSDVWGFVNQHYSSTYCVSENYLWWRHNRAKGVPSFPSSNSSSVALELKPDTSGTFTACLDFITATSSVQYDVYLFEKPEDTTAWYCDPDGNFSNTGAAAYREVVVKIPASARIGHFDAYGNGEGKKVYFPNVTVDKDKNYYFILTANGANEKWVPDTSSANYSFGTLKLRSFVLADFPAKEELPTLTYNISSNSVKSDMADTLIKASTNNATIDNSEMTLLSWRDVYYAMNGTTVVKKNAQTAGAIKGGQSLDLSKTDPFEFQGRSNNDNAPALNSEGFVSQLYAKIYSVDDVETSNEYAKASPASPSYTVRINVPKAGEYSLSVLNNFAASSASIQNTFRENGKATGEFTTGVFTKVYVAKAEFELVQGGTGYPDGSATPYARIVNDKNFVGWYDSGKTAQTSEIGNVYFPSAGEYFVSFNTCNDSFEKNAKAYHRKYDTKYVDFQLFLLSGIKLTPVDNAELMVSDKAYDEIVNIDAGNGKEVATTIENAEVKAVAADISGNAIGSGAIIPSETVAVGSSYNATAPEIEGYKFLYWAKGIGKNRKVVSHNEKYSFKVTSGGTLLMAVYAKNESADNVAMFYNGNGQLLATQTGESFNAPALPSMAGFGAATHWALAGSGEEFAAGASGAISGEMSFVAQYGDVQNVKITVTNGNGGGNVAYGSNVTVTANERNGMNVFSYWENENGEVLSFDLSYTFKALRNATVKAVYAEYNPKKSTIKKIVVSNDGKNVFAEFIGISDVIERGILFGEDASLGNYTAKVTMNTDGDEFSVYNDLEDEPKAIGYAILAGGKVIYSK